MKIRKITYSYHIETYIGPDRDGGSTIIVDLYTKKEDVEELIRKRYYDSMHYYDLIGVNILKDEIIEVKE